MYHPGDLAAPTRFDAQAATFDKRAGIPPQAAAEIALAVLDGRRSPEEGEVVLELGAGTGEVGCHLAGLARAYVGMDVSAPMLDVFRSKLAGTAAPRTALLVRADADWSWPVRDRSVSVVFASRVAHLLAREHLVQEVRRVCHHGGRFVVGRIERSGIKQALQRQRRAMLAERGLVQGQSGGRRSQELLESFLGSGAAPEPRRTAATWTVTTTAEAVIASWETMSTMGGVTIPAEVRTELLVDLRRWAREELGDLDRPWSHTERYTLEGVRLGCSLP